MMPETTAAKSEHFQLTHTLFDAIACGTLVVSPSAQILALNPAAEQLTGLKPDEVLGRPLSVLPPALQAIVRETLTANGPVPDREVPLPGSPGAALLLQVRARAARQPDGSLLCVLLEMRNLGQARAIAASLEHLDRLSNVGLLSASVAHEIKNALVAVQTFVDLLLERTQGDELAPVVAKELRRIEAAVKQTLRGATREEFHMAPLHAHALLQETANLLRYEFQRRSVRLELKLAAPSDRIQGDERQLRHALLNLFINALEAMNSSGDLGVATEVMDNRHLRLTISDTGEGIRAEHLPQLFDPFFTTKKEGTGLGLAITRRIIRGHDGAITVESQVRKGTTVQILLPLL